MKNLVVALGTVMMCNLPAQADEGFGKLNEFYTHLQKDFVVFQKEYTDAVDALNPEKEELLSKSTVGGTSLMELNNKIVYDLMVLQARVNFMLQGLKNLDTCK